MDNDVQIVNGGHEMSDEGSPRPFSSPMKIPSFYDLRARKINGGLLNFQQLQGKVVLVVNMALMCPDAVKQLIQLNRMATKFAGRLSILVFPCSQFTHESFEDGELLKMLRTVRPGEDFQPLFTTMASVDVNGSATHPVFRFLRDNMPIPSNDSMSFAQTPSLIGWAPVERSDITNNFEKFLVCPKGRVVRRYTAQILPVKLYGEIDLFSKQHSICN